MAAPTVMRRHPILVPLLVLVIGLAVTGLVARELWRQQQAIVATRFDSQVAQAQLAIIDRLNTYAAGLEATAGFIATRQDLAAADFRVFVRHLQLTSRYPGIQGIGWSVRLAPQEVAAFEAARRRDGSPQFRVWPEGPREEYHATAFLEPLDRRNAAAIGFDMFSERIRREAMERARDSGLPAASGRVELVQEIDADRQAGFLIYVPVYRGYEPPQSPESRREGLLGFVYAPFRGGDLLRAIFEHGLRRPLEIEIYDGEASTGWLLHASANPTTPRRAGTPMQQRQLDVFGRRWTVRYFATPELAAATGLPSIPAVLALGLALTGLVTTLTWSQTRAWQQARREVVEREKAEAQRAILLHELNHRVKNIFSTVLAIARQTVRSTRDPTEIPAVLTARLTALANTHTLLTRSEWTGAELRAMLETELKPYGCLDRGRCTLNGPKVELSPRMSLPLSLVFHELITNAVKYGALSGSAGAIEIVWQVEGGHGEERLTISWRERDGPLVTPPERNGFGSRLIESGIVQQLQGELERSFDSAGFRCRIVIPLDAPEQEPDLPAEPPVREPLRHQHSS